MAAREGNRIEYAARRADGTARRTLSCAVWLVAAMLAVSSIRPALAQTGAVQTDPLPLTLPEIDDAAGEEAASGPEVARLKDALQEMNTQNPVVARVDGHDIRWADVVASAADLPPRYRDRIETVFPALLDRLVDLRLLADAAREQGLRDDPVVLKRMASYEDLMLSSVLLERSFEEEITVTGSLSMTCSTVPAAMKCDRIAGIQGDYLLKGIN